MSTSASPDSGSIAGRKRRTSGGGGGETPAASLTTATSSASPSLSAAATTTATTAAAAAAATTTTTTSSSKRTRANPDELPTHRPIRVYCDGIYDLFHTGHARSLRQAKHLFGDPAQVYLLVGCCNDALTHRLKGQTVMSDRERYESLEHCRWVDEVVRDAPWIVTQEFLDEHRIDYVAHGEDACLDADGNDIYAFVKAQGKFKTIKRTDGISTTDLIMRIIRNYDTYVRRNLRRGVSRHDMNVSFVKEHSLRLQDGVGKIGVDLGKWRDNAGHLYYNFLRKFTLAAPPAGAIEHLRDGSTAGDQAGDDDGDDDDDDAEPVNLLASPPQSPTS